MFTWQSRSLSLMLLMDTSKKLINSHLFKLNLLKSFLRLYEGLRFRGYVNSSHVDFLRSRIKDNQFYPIQKGIIWMVRADLHGAVCAEFFKINNREVGIDYWWPPTIMLRLSPGLRTHLYHHNVLPYQLLSQIIAIVVNMNPSQNQRGHYGPYLSDLTI